MSYASPDEIVRLIHQCESPWAKVCLALAFYGDPFAYGIDPSTGVRQEGRAQPIDLDLGRVARAVQGFERPST